MLFVRYQQVQLAVLFYFHTQLIQPFDRRVAGEEVLRARPEGDDLQPLIPRIAREIGTNSAIFSAISSAVPIGYSGI